jgi:acetylornithine deacetylase/succinyl-diaminopimelate desuccinylase-like protein
MPDVTTICRDLTRIRSVGDRDGEGGAVAYLASLFADLPGARCEVVEPAPGRPSLIVTLQSAQPGPTLLLNGHTDTVSETPGWTHDPYGGETSDGRLWGLGTMDMKGGVAGIVAATLEVAAEGGPRAGRLVLAATADEDAGMEWGVPWLAERGLLDADAAIVAESAGVEADFEHLHIAGRGYGYVEVEVRREKLAHASRYDPAQPHAVAVAAALVTAIENGFTPRPATHPLYPGGPTVVAGYELSGGEALGRLAEHATFSVGARLLPGGDGETFMADLTAFVRERARGATVDVRPVATSPFARGMEIDADHPLVGLAVDAVQRAGYPAPRLAGGSGFTEGAFLAARGIPTLPALGPGLSPLAHGPDEWVSVEALERSVRIYRDLIDQILRPDSPIATTRRS